MRYDDIRYIFRADGALIQTDAFHQLDQAQPLADIDRPDAVFCQGSVFIYQRNDVTDSSDSHQVECSVSTLSADLFLLPMPVPA